MARRFIYKQVRNKKVRPMFYATTRSVAAATTVTTAATASEANGRRVNATLSRLSSRKADSATISESNTQNISMEHEQQIDQISQILDTAAKGKKARGRIKIEKKEKGLIETTESTVVLTEDNKMLLND